MSRHRLLLLAAVAVAVLSPRPARAQSTQFTAGAGPTTFTVIGFGGPVGMVDFFRLVLLDAAGQDAGELFRFNGDDYAYQGGALRPRSGFAVTPLALALTAGDVFGFRAIFGAGQTEAVGLLNTLPTGYNVEMWTPATRTRIEFELAGITPDVVDATCSYPNARAQFCGGTTVPEPASVVLLGTGLLALGGITAHRRRRHQ